jgi:hypothetical protein
MARGIAAMAQSVSLEVQALGLVGHWYKTEAANQKRSADKWKLATMALLAIEVWRLT